MNVGFVKSTLADFTKPYFLPLKIDAKTRANK